MSSKMQKNHQNTLNYYAWPLTIMNKHSIWSVLQQSCRHSGDKGDGPVEDVDRYHGNH